MKRQGGSFWLASIGCAAALAGSAAFAPARAQAPAPPAVSIPAPPEPAADGGLDRRAEAGGVAIEPELPPEVDRLPPELAPKRAAEAPAAPPPVAPRVETAEGMAADQAAAAVEAAIEAMLQDGGRSARWAPRRARVARLAIGVFYFERAFAPLWTDADGFTPRARAAIARLARAAEDGLDLTGVPIPPAGASAGSAAQRAAAEVALSQAVIAYAVQASGGRLEPSAISPEITARPEVADPLQALARVAAAQDADAALQDFNPPHKGYRDLREKLAQLRSEAASAATIPPDPAVSAGLDDRRVPLIRTRFGIGAHAEGPASGDLGQPVEVAAAIGGFPHARKTPPPARLAAGAARAPGQEEAAIVANMEMWRWEPRDMGEERVEVNVPDFTLRLLRGDETVHKARVIVGKPDTRTAIFSNQIKYLLVNPAWVVPMSIVRKEMMPKLALDPDYLVHAGFEVTRKGDTLTVRQPPGEHNALGHLLFMFPNEHSIYLHDTPSRGLFAAQRRAFSHGCVRVDDPMRLGELAMGGAQAGWSQARLRALEGGSERTIFLPHPLAIHIEYFTAFVDDSGALQLREDIYGHERRVEEALGLAVEG